MKKIRILIADDHSLMRAGLKSMINHQVDMQVVGEAANGDQAVALVRSTRPDVIVMDLMMPVLNGADAVRLIMEDLPGSNIIILTSFGTSADLSRAMAAGAKGAQAKESPTEDLLSAIRTVARGGTAIAHELQRVIDANPAPPNLTERQKEILAAAVRGFSNKEIGKALGISPVSVKKHLSVIFNKIGASNRAEAISITLRTHLLQI